MAVNFTDGNFQEKVLGSNVAVVDFWAVWCGPCKMVGPIIEELANDYEGRATIGKMDVDHNPKRSGEFGVRSIPTVLFFRNGKVVDKIVGATTKANYEKKLLNILTAAEAETLRAKPRGVTADDLTKIEGIGPKTAGILTARNIKTFTDLADTEVSDLREYLEEGGISYRLVKPDTWPAQAVLAAKGDWAALKVLQDKIMGGKLIG